MKEFFNTAALSDNPLSVLGDFLNNEVGNEAAGKFDEMRFVGYILEAGYDKATIITSDPFKVAVGGVPRNSLLIMVPAVLDGQLPPHFTLLRVLESAPTPLARDVQQTYFELQKKSMPELDIFTQSELQWGALKTEVLGMFYPHPDKRKEVEFSGDLNNFVSAHKYMVYAPTDPLLDLIVNCLVPLDHQFTMGKLRLTENRLPLPTKNLPDVDVNVSTDDFRGARTAMFGKTRLGKSNIVKLIAQSLIETYRSEKTVGQLIFDINGEYANDNPQDNNGSLKSAYKDDCVVYALTKKDTTDSKQLKLNFYDQAASAKNVLEGLLEQDNKTAIYVKAFTSAELSTIQEIPAIESMRDKATSVRKLQAFWSILFDAGYAVDETSLKAVAPWATQYVNGFNPGFNKELRSAAYAPDDAPSAPATLSEMSAEFKTINKYRHSKPDDKNVAELDSDLIALMDFLAPKSGSGTSMIKPYRKYHDKNAGHYVEEILKLLDEGKTVILDLGNAEPQLVSYFSDSLSKAVFNHQVDKFSNNQLDNHFVQLYFEEAHNLFPNNSKDVTTIYNRFAKEGAKYHIGMVYSTQSPTTVSKDLLAQTENFFIAHLSSRDEVEALAKLNIAYESLRADILSAKTPGYVRMLTRSHRFAIPVQAKRFEPTKSQETE